MSLERLDVFRVRNILQAAIAPSAGINLIYGANGSGKSSLLEAIFILGRASSFRTNNIKNVINHNANDLIVSGQSVNQRIQTIQLGVKFAGKACDIHINQQSNCKRSDLAYSLPIQLIHPKSYLLLDGNSTLRREYVDWGVFNQHENYLGIWRKFKKALSQRNALLKTKSIQYIQAWDNELDHYANLVVDYRNDYLTVLEPIFIDICRYFLCFQNIQLKFFSGWTEVSDYRSVLNSNIEKDLRYGFTQFGPQRWDFDVLLNNRSASDFVSRGQLKLLVLSLLLAQVQLLHQKSGKIGCILIDDITAELDINNRAKLLAYLQNMNMQVFISANQLTEFGNLSNLHDLKMFHVEHGKIQQN